MATSAARQFRPESYTEAVPLPARRRLVRIRRRNPEIRQTQVPARARARIEGTASYAGQARKQGLLTAGYMDYSMVLIVFFLAIFGLIMLFSTSSFEAGLKFGSPAHFLKRQMAATVFGVFVMLFLSWFPDYHVLEKLAWPAYLFSCGLIFLVLTPLGYEANGARRWLDIKGVSIQPAEVAKLSMIVFLATMCCHMRNKLGTKKGTVVFLGTVLPVVLMIYKITENLSSALIVLGIAFVMLFIATPGYGRFIALALAGAAAAYGLIYYIINYCDPESSVRFARIFAWHDLETYADTKGYQTLQSLYAIGSGGVFGKGLGESIQKTGYVPEAQNDMIFSIICEELGLFGGIAVIIMFLMLLWRLMIIAQNAPDLFGALLCVGVMGHIALQVFLNIAVVTNLMPNTGITLPFISYGGSAVVMQMAEIGIVMNVARRIRA